MLLFANDNMRPKRPYNLNYREICCINHILENSKSKVQKCGEFVDEEIPFSRIPNRRIIEQESSYHTKEKCFTHLFVTTNNHHV